MDPLTPKLIGKLTMCFVSRQDLRRERRQQRKTLEALMGYKQEQRKRRLETSSRSLSSPPLLRKGSAGGEGVPPNHTSTLTVHHSSRTRTPDLLSHSEFMKASQSFFLDTYAFQFLSKFSSNNLPFC